MDRINHIFSSTSAATNTLQASVAVFAALLATYLYNDYRTYMSMGPGGIPHNVLGWLIASLLKPLALAADVLSVAPYDEATESAYLEHVLPRRHGKRPAIGSHPVPHRQLDQLPSDEVKSELVKRVERLYEAAMIQGLAEVRMSLLEKHTDALYVVENAGGKVSESARLAAQDTSGEFAHIHTTGDHSLHLILSPADCKKVIEAGWGERHAFDASRLVRRLLNVKLSITYLMIYAPRNDKEVAIALSIMKASIRYMTGQDVDT